MYSFISAAYGPVFYTCRRRTMSGQHLSDSDSASTSDRSSVGTTRPPTSIVKQHNYEQIDHAHFLANDIGTLYLNDRLDSIILFIFLMQEVER